MVRSTWNLLHMRIVQLASQNLQIRLIAQSRSCGRSLENHENVVRGDRIAGTALWWTMLWWKWLAESKFSQLAKFEFRWKSSFCRLICRKRSYRFLFHFCSTFQFWILTKLFWWIFISVKCCPQLQSHFGDCTAVFVWIKTYVNLGYGERRADLLPVGVRRMDTVLAPSHHSEVGI